MLTGIDHVIIACADPEAAAAELETAVGLRATGGGRHQGLGTFNRIAWLGDAYIELIGVEDRDAAARHPVTAAALHVLDERGGGFCGFALASDHLDTDAANLRAAGASIGPVVHGSRRNPDGDEVAWSAAFPERGGPDGLPFLIQHAPVGREWAPDRVAERRTLSHPLGSPALLARLDVAASDPAGLAAEFHEQLGIEFWVVTELAVSNVGPHVLRLVPIREMPVPAVVTIGAEVADLPRTVEVLGMRFDLEYVDLPLPAPNLA